MKLIAVNELIWFQFHTQSVCAVFPSARGVSESKTTKLVKADWAV